MSTPDWAHQAIQHTINQMNPLDRLTLWKNLTETRDNTIKEARDKGHTWTEISQATGLSRQRLSTTQKRRKQTP